MISDPYKVLGLEQDATADDIKKQLHSEQGLTITYIVRTLATPLVDHEVLKEKITLEQCGIIEISSSSEESLSYFDNSFIKLKRLIEIASFKKVNVEKVHAYSSNILYTIGENTKIAKDVSASAVLVSAIMSLIAGFIIFLPKVLGLV